MRTKIAVITVIAAAWQTMACESSGVPVSENGNALQTRQLMYAFRATWPTRDTTQTALRAHRIAEIASGASLSANSFMDAIRSASRTHRTFAPLPGLRVAYSAEQDDLRVDVSSVSGDDSPGPDVGKQAARAKFDETVRVLARDGLINDADYDLTNLDVGYRKAGSAPAGETAVSYVTSYIFTALRQVNGIPFANAGVRVGVHR